ncbi:MAG: zinc ABC transporter substrate-binding protein [Bacteroidales bacterium]|nr:zinc ABC transporter substrate-binding protein [Bacteroidales bacterium]
MKLNGLNFYLILNTFFIVFVSCGTMSNRVDFKSSSRLNVVATTTMITDLVYQICGDSINLTGLMGSGVDPHLYKATEGDVFRIFDADVIFYNGLHLEGRLEDIFRKMKQRNINSIALADALDKEDLIKSEGGQELYDPHIWFSVQNWKQAAIFITKSLIEMDEKNAAYYSQSLQRYLQELTDLENFISESVEQIPSTRRVLITAHDAFGYFGHEFGFEVIGLQGISTISESGAKDVRKLADVIFDRQIPAVFIESSVSDRNIKALKEAVASRGFEIRMGGTLYSDALGSEGTPEGTYVGMYKHNMRTIREALK